MANLKEIRSRIASVSSTMQITSAMKMVSAAKLKKAQDAILAMKPYAYKLKQLLEHLSSALGDESQYSPRKGEAKKVLIVVITSNRGLCGAFNSNVIKKALELEQTAYKGKEVQFYAIGKKGNDVLKKTDRVYKVETEVFDNVSFNKVTPLAEELMQLYVTSTFDEIVLVYNSFKNAATQIITDEIFLPVQPAPSENGVQIDYIYEPSQEEIVAELIPRSLKTQLFKALRDSVASEHGARMTAMHKATDNATELIGQLKLTYNKARQATITGEIIEIVGGSEALA
ncbi:ATP synthase F1 subcomplex gamma subunit [Capnocytophaga haemolytica]|uniref:ATP synthase gamma chain n=1 Tax=Capnocytophaga haemolytica TaxID=45243 RepID=A0AAX2GZ35_9FLAO|nr:ATP synthase F1 subunit gamma [Capnocytophaga haemolytica]AMD84688.1 F0F1 ATP synthase subunit gamma [Capnocytophaga haemolytica]SFO20924.1 ATP synthase F1 subcomplex gamma subunit [Capnocytophaga haemolytica]SNV08395.1 F-ATPase gamma subunit [Capnocytophaga haemolytica]